MNSILNEIIIYTQHNYNLNKKNMGGALLTRKENFLQDKLQNQLKSELKNAENKRDEKILKIQNKTIRKVQKLNIEYKYSQATKNMIHDGEESQASSMLAALRYVGILS